MTREEEYIDYLERELERQFKRCDDYHERIMMMIDFVSKTRKLTDTQHLELLKIAFPE